MDSDKEVEIFSRRRKIRVLVVEDTRTIRSSLMAFLFQCDDLELAGDAISGKRAINLIERLKPDVVLLGLVLEGMDGLTTLQKIHSKYPQTPVIVITPGHGKDQVEAALAAGAAAHVREGFSAEEMIIAIQSVQAQRWGPVSTTGVFYHPSHL